MACQGSAIELRSAFSPMFMDTDVILAIANRRGKITFCHLRIWTVIVPKSRREQTAQVTIQTPLDEGFEYFAAVGCHSGGRGFPTATLGMNLQRKETGWLDIGFELAFFRHLSLY